MIESRQAYSRRPRTFSAYALASATVGRGGGRGSPRRDSPKVVGSGAVQTIHGSAVGAGYQMSIVGDGAGGPAVGGWTCGAKEAMGAFADGIGDRAGGANAAPNRTRAPSHASRLKRETCGSGGRRA